MLTQGFLLLGVAVALISAFFIKFYICDAYRIPAVSLYVILGVLASVLISQLLEFPLLEKLEHLEFISKLALGLIAFIIGSELDKKVILALGKSILYIAFFEAFITFVLVTGSLLFFFPQFPSYYAIILGAVASATAPAATVSVIRQYKARGPLTSTIMGVVGIDDAISLIIYVFASIFASHMLLPSADASQSTLLLILKPFISIALSALVGGGVGYLYVLSLKKIRDNEIILMAVFGFILLLLGISEILHISELLTIMVFGAVLANTNAFVTSRAKQNLENLSPLLLPLFFIFAGARLDVSLIGAIGILGLVYTLTRMVGKVGGAYLGAVLGKATPTVKKLIGFSLIPQVGVAVALALAVDHQFGKHSVYGAPGIALATIVINVLLFTTLITEVIGPLLTRFALKKAGEIDPS